MTESSRIDTGALTRGVDILALIAPDTPLKKVASTQGGEWAGPCPFCGGEDRFRVQPEMRRWWCRQCAPDEHWDDAITYVMKRHGKTFVEACTYLGAVPDLPYAGPRDTPDPTPTATYRQTAEMTVAAAVTALWSPGGEKALQWLANRGLSETTIMRRELGLYLGRGPEDRGITIPWRVGGELWHVNVRRPSGKPKFKSLPGGHPWMYGADDLGTHPYVFLTEGEFDCMLLAQEIDDLGLDAGVASLGAARKGLGRRARSMLMLRDLVIAVYDTDEAGTEGVAALIKSSARIRGVQVPQGGDITGYWLELGPMVGIWAMSVLHDNILHTPEPATPATPPPPARTPTLYEEVVDLLHSVDGWAVPEAATMALEFTDAELRAMRTQLLAEAKAG